MSLSQEIAELFEEAQGYVGTHAATEDMVGAYSVVVAEGAAAKLAAWREEVGPALARLIERRGTKLYRQRNQERVQRWNAQQRDNKREWHARNKDAVNARRREKYRAMKAAQ